ncbi:MAG: efflux RND transporter periplasmic adaptor subunit [Hyphomicrobiales bacterium]|nr:efflux RND transporter periplasmic adaptor subunit [Hyphomicrobiales bacterium]
MRTSYLVALAITVGVAGWMSTGTILVAGRSDSLGSTPEQAGRPIVDELRHIAGLPVDEKPADGATVASPPAVNTSEIAADGLFQVRVRTFTAGIRQSVLTVSGRTEADYKVSVRAETGGIVAERLVGEGEVVKAGTPLCRIDRGAREARLAQAKASLSQAEFDLTGATKLEKSGFTSEARVRALQATADAARAAVEDAELDLARTEIKAPAAGVVQSPLVEAGDMLTVGGVCATLIDVDPILVIAQVSERDIGNLTKGMPANTLMVTGEKRTGAIRYIAPSADPATRTFRIEIEINNGDHKIRDGVTAHADIPLVPIKAHQLSPSILTLDDDGRIGLRGVDDRNTVVFWPVKIIAGEKDGVWVTGLPDEVRLITVGQEYVKAGAVVDPVEESTLSAETQG